MSTDEILAQIQSARDDPAKLTIVTLDAVLASRGQSELRPAVDAVAIPHWFDARILSCLMEADAESIQGLFSNLCALPMVETFRARNGMNVHFATRMALRDYLFKTDPERFHHLSNRAVSCLSGDEPHLRIEMVYHHLTADPQQGTEALRQLCSQWEAAGHYENLQSLSVVLEELLKHQPLAPIARAQSIIRFCFIRGASLPLQQMESLAQEALAVFLKSNILPDLIDTYNLLGHTMFRQGRLEPALHHYRHQADICRALARRDPDNNEWRLDLSISHNCVGRVFQAQGRLPEALAEYEAARRIMQELTAHDPDNAGWQRELSISHNCVGGVFEAQDRLPEALAEYEAYRRIMQELTARDPDNAGWQRELSISHNYVGGVLWAQDRLPEALAEYEAYRRIMQELTARDPDNAGWQRELSISHNCVGRVLQALGRLEEALAEYEAYRRIMQELTAHDPDNARWQRDLSISHNCVGRGFQALGRLEEALVEYEASKRILLALIAIGADNVQWTKDLQMTQELLDSAKRLRPNTEERLS